MRTAIEAQMETRDSVPVWVSDADFSGCYDSFCHQVRIEPVFLLAVKSHNSLPQVLWPSLHYIIPDAPKTSVMYESSSFVQYKAVNEAFADAVARVYKEGDISEYPFPESL
jgi:trehalose 6-phosphate synthase complex regulatory subunit